ncbi:Lrp/AsnC family transcriptional regulator [bacterium]|nr:Lrp/AsnC family transcriptional regulator [bacterium]
MNQLTTDVLNLLTENARMDLADIADQLSVTQEAVQAEMTELENQRIIIQYTTVIDEKKLPSRKARIKALIEVSVRPEKRTGFEAIAEKIAQFKNVVDMYLVSGGYDFLVIVEGDSLEEISSFVSDKLASIDNVRSTATHFIMKKYKEKGIVIGKQNREERLAVSP